MRRVVAFCSAGSVRKRRNCWGTGGSMGPWGNGHWTLGHRTGDIRYIGQWTWNRGLIWRMPSQTWPRSIVWFIDVYWQLAFYCCDYFWWQVAGGGGWWQCPWWGARVPLAWPLYFHSIGFYVLNVVYLFLPPRTGTPIGEKVRGQARDHKRTTNRFMTFNFGSELVGGPNS